MSADNPNTASPLRSVSSTLGAADERLKALFDPYFTTPAPLDRRTFWIGFSLVLALGAVLRFWQLGDAPLWLDEAASLGFSSLPLDTILTDGIDNHPPLFYVIQHLWMQVFPDLDQARIPVALIGTASLAVLMLSVRDVISGRTALIAGLLFAVATTQIYYSQELRMYGLLVLGLITALWGAIGMVRPGRYGQMTYAGLYALGGILAIYSQLVGLVAMALIGFPSLLMMLLGPNWRPDAIRWFQANLVILVVTLPWLIQVPALSASFPGLPATGTPFDIQWHYRNAVAHPALGVSDLIQLLADGLILALAGLSLILAWTQRQTLTALSLGGLMVVYPIIVLILHLMNPMMHARVFLPSGIVVAIGVAYLLSHLKDQRIGLGLTALMAVFGFSSAVLFLSGPRKSQDFPTAYDIIDEAGYADAPLIVVDDFLAAVAWETQPGTEIYSMEKEIPVRYDGPSHWRVLEKSIIWYRDASAQEIDLHLGGGLIPEGGLAGLADNNSRIVLARHGGSFDETRDAFLGLGYEEITERDVFDGHLGATMLDPPQLHLIFMERASD